MLALTALLIYVPVLQSVTGMTALPARDLVLLLPFPFIIWGADELRRWRARRRAAAAGQSAPGRRSSISSTP